jgi:hypothetical protein
LIDGVKDWDLHLTRDNLPACILGWSLCGVK